MESGSGPVSLWGAAQSISWRGVIATRMGLGRAGVSTGNFLATLKMLISMVPPSIVFPLYALQPVCCGGTGPKITNLP